MTQDRAREAFAQDVFDIVNCREHPSRPGTTREKLLRRLDSFLTTVLEGADEHIKELMRRHNDDSAHGTGEWKELHEDRAELLTLVTALSAKLKEQKAAHAKILRDYANHEPLDLRRPAEIQHDLRRLADKIEGGE